MSDAVTTIAKITEAQLQDEIAQLAGQVGLIVLAEKLNIGNFQPDGIAWDRRGSGGLVIIELKTVMNTDLLGQALLYPRALRKALPLNLANLPIRCLLISTYFDKGVIELSGAIKEIVKVELQLVKLDADQRFRLEPPTDADENQVWDQAELKASKRGRFDDFVKKLDMHRSM